MHSLHVVSSSCEEGGGRSDETVVLVGTGEETIMVKEI